MKPTNHPSQLKQLLCATVILGAASSAYADTQAWNNDGTTNFWNTTDTNWTGASTIWTNGNDATFGGTGEAISINTTGITAHNLTFGVGGYSIGSSAPANTLTLNGTTPTIEVTNLADSATISSIIAGSSGLTKTGAGTLNLNAANTYTGATVINDNSGKVTLDQLGSLRTTSGITIGTGSTLELKATSVTVDSRDKLFSATNAGALVINGTLSNTGTSETRLSYASSITMNNGSILCSGGETTWGSFLFSASGTIAANGASNTISGTGNGLGISSGAILTLDTALATDALAVSAKIGVTSAMAGAVQKTGLGIVTLSGTNIYTGTTTIDTNGGTLQFAKTISFYSNTVNGTNAAKLIVNSGGTAAFNVGAASGEFTEVNIGTLLGASNATVGFKNGSNLGLDTTNAVGGNFNYNGTIANTFAGANALGLTKLGTNTLTLNGNNSYSGGTTVKAGTLTAGHANAFGTGKVTLAGGSLKTGAHTVANDVDITGNAAISGTYSGKVDSGTDASRAINTTGGVSIDELAGQGTFSGGLVTIVGSHTPGNSPGTQTFNTGLTYGNGASLTLEISAVDTNYDILNITGGLNIGTGVALTLSLYGADDYSGSFWNSNQTFTLINADTVAGDFLTPTNNLGGAGEGSWSYGWVGNQYKATWTAVPEPSAALLGSIGVLFLLRRRRA